MLFDVFIQTFAGKNAFQTFLSICLLILCLYPVIGALFWCFVLVFWFIKLSIFEKREKRSKLCGVAHRQATNDYNHDSGA